MIKKKNIEFSLKKHNFFLKKTQHFHKIGKIRATLWRRIRVTSPTAIDDAQWKFPMVGGELLVSWEGLR